MRSRLRAADLLPLASIGMRSRPLRAALSTLGIAIGVAAIVGVLGITRSSQADLIVRIDDLGTDLLTVANGSRIGGDEAQLPPSSATGVARTDGVRKVTATAGVPQLRVFRTDLVPAYRGGGVEVRATEPTLLDTLDGHLAAGVFLNDATARYPVAVLGHDAATALGVAQVGAGTRIWLGGHWFTVAGILRPFELAPEIDRAALIGLPAAAAYFGFDGHPTRLYVRAETTRTAAVAGRLARAANPAEPNAVTVSRPSDALASRLLVADSVTSLLLGLGAVALLVGGVGVANVMVVSVLERRTEIGLRRALGAARRHVTAQFMTESLLLSVLGGLTGVLLGAAVTHAVAAYRGWQPLVPLAAVAGGFAATLLVGVVAGVYPAVRAARLDPTDALRTA
ncbi:ABC transporter permease [Dactylosporangium aurantiacum]|uniref:ABC transporter permease n=1 Tax=Dactylosporangium aurantiacum TaxID=35754 RepID=A0A9Q9MCB3_9ACTN|nr:ABC transporter permease [Dactylosporangium aurantiacum]MDG6110469.1 ABC transporter permease [Dactylosporangium aurantiacum]UWZ50739.1 ABC transporter permease [Dactylosporangium aurantiacum]